MSNKVLNESVLDPIQKQRCDAMFNPNDKREQPVLLYSTKQFIFSLLEKFKEETGLKKMEYTQAFIVGSSLGYQYRDDCDIDVDVRINLTRSEMKGKFHCIPKNILLPNTSHPVNIFLLTSDDEEYNFDNAESAYDLLTDTWIKQGRLENADKIPFEYVAGVSEFLMDGITLQLSRAERDLYDLNKYMNIDPNKVAISESERKAFISQKISDLIIDKDAIKLAHTLMFRLNRDAFDDKPISFSIKYTYEDKHYSMNNLIYKYLDQYKYYEKIEEMAKVIDETIKKAKEILKVVVDNSPETKNQIEAQKEVIEKAMETEVPEAVQPEENAQEVEATENVITEQYSDDELKSILLENGLEPSLLNVFKLRIHDYYITEAIDDEFDSLLDESWFMDLKRKVQENANNRLKQKTYKKLNKIIYKASGKRNPNTAAVTNWLFGGIVGGIIAHELRSAKNERLDDFEQYLIDEVEGDSDCQSLIQDIKTELSNPEPDKEKLRSLKKKFAIAVNNLKKALRKRTNNYYDPNKMKDVIS